MGHLILGDTKGILTMFVRKKKYPSGNIGVIVVEKIGGKMKELATIGVAHNEDEVENLVNEGYLINTDIPIQDVYTAYHNLWYVERAFYYLSLKVIGTLYFTFTGSPFCLPGFHAGIAFTTRIASSSRTV